MTRGKNGTPIVVGIDGNEDGLRAAEFAATQATTQGRGIRIVHAYHLLAGLNPMLTIYGTENLRESGELALDEAEKLLGSLAPDVPVERLLVAGSAAPALVEASKSASLVVVGRRAVHGISRLLSGSKSTAIAARAHCPVVSVPASWSGGRASGPIVVGVDGSVFGRDALAYAFEQASDQRSDLTAVRSWEIASRWYVEIPDLGGEAAQWLEGVKLGLAEDLAGWSEQFPDVPLERVFERSSSPAEALLRRSEGASLLIIGARGQGGVPGLDLGWTAHSVLAHATCPVIVVHHGDRAPDGHLVAAGEVASPLADGLAAPVAEV